MLRITHVSNDMKSRFALTKYAHPILLALVAMLMVYGTLMVNSATEGTAVKRQLFGIGVGLVLMIFFWAFDYKKFKDWIMPLFIFNAFLMISPRIPGLGAAAKGAQSWLEVAGIRLFQPSEPAKLVTILLLAALVSRYAGKIESFKDFLKLVGLSLIPVALILTQPDLGTGLVFIAIAFGILLVGGAKLRWLALAFAVAALLAGGIIWLDGKLDAAFDEDVLLKKYQMDRLLVFVDPDIDPRGAGYNLKQSKIAIGSGEFSGKGYSAGTQGNLFFLPERHTDFIFAVVGEELGFVGGALLLGLYLALMIVSLTIAAQSSDLFGSLVGVGIISMWVFMILENAGMTMGLMPITGIPLPFMSYGSSFMVTNLACIGVLLSIWRQRPFVSESKGAV